MNKRERERSTLSMPRELKLIIVGGNRAMLKIIQRALVLESNLNESATINVQNSKFINRAMYTLAPVERLKMRAIPNPVAEGRYPRKE